MSEKSLTKELAMGSILTGQISEVHAVNIKMYPFIFLDDVYSADISFDIVTDPISALPGKKSTICYNLHFNSNQKPPSLKEGYKNLKKALEILFSQEIIVLLKDKNGQDLVQENG